MPQKEMLSRLCDDLGLAPSVRSTSQLGAILLLHVAIRSMPRGPNAQRRKVLSHYAAVATGRKTIPETMIDRLCRQWGKEDEKDDPAWIEEIVAIVKEPRFREAFPPELLVAGLIPLLPHQAQEKKRLWDRIDRIAESFGIDRFFLDTIHGYVTNACDEETRVWIERMKEEWGRGDPVIQRIVEAIVPEAAGATSSVQAASRPFPELRKELLPLIDHLEAEMKSTGLTLELLVSLRQRLKDEHFRLAVLGEFKRGKSTFVNALIGIPGLMPSATLPCTSAPTEVLYGEKQRFLLSSGNGLPGTFQERREEEFRKGVAQASKQTRKKEEAKEAASRVPYWRVEVPSPLLEDAGVSIIDTPGIGEDHSRDEIAKSEARRADAAVLLFDATQLASLEELKWLKEMKSKIKDLFLVINKADCVEEWEHLSLIEHLLERIRSEVTGDFPAERISLQSAGKAEEALERGDRHDPWLQRLHELRATLQEELLARANTIKVTHLRKEIRGTTAQIRKELQKKEKDEKDMFQNLTRLPKKAKEAGKAYEQAKRDCRIAVNTVTNAKRAQQRFWEAFEAALPEILDRFKKWAKDMFQNLTRLPKKAKEAGKAYEQAKRDCRIAVNTVTNAKRAQQRFWEAFEAALPEILDRFKKRAKDWNADKGVIPNPKLFVEAITPQAQESLIREIEQWVEAEGTPILAEEMERNLEAAKKAIERVARYIERQTGIEEEHLTAKVREAALRGALGGSAVGDIDIPEDLLTKGIPAMGLGYIVPHIVLYYILGVISGFLNPFLLAGALIAGIGLFFTGGTAMIKNKIKEKVAEEIAKKVGSSEMKKKMKEEIEKGIETLFSQMGRALEGQLWPLIREAEKQRALSEEQRKKFIEQTGRDRRAWEERMRAFEEKKGYIERILQGMERIVEPIPRIIAESRS